jgi:hypothetical protein
MKSQNPNPKTQISAELQIPNGALGVARTLEFGNWNLFGIWNLEFGIFLE